MDFQNLHQILRDLYNEMMPLCSSMASVGKAMAGLGATFYIAYRVWTSLARAEPIDVFPLLRPFVVTICIMFFPTLVVGTLNSILSPVVKGTNQILENQTLDMHEYRAAKDKLEYEIMVNNEELAYLVSNEAFDEKIESLGWGIKAWATMGAMYINRWEYNMNKRLRSWLRELLELIFHAVGLCIDTIRTFFLIVLTVLGPIAFGISVFDGFQSTIVQWLSRYIGTYLWLPVSDIFSSILARLQVLMIQKDIEMLQATGDCTLIDESQGIYCVFLIIGIIGYFTVPHVASWVVSGGGAGSFGRNINRAFTGGGAFMAGRISKTGGSIKRGVKGQLARDKAERQRRREEKEQKEQEQGSDES